MFGATSSFGQSTTSSPFGSQSVFGQTNNVSNNPFAPKPSGGTTPFGSQTGGSLFGGTSTGVFGMAQSSSAFGSTSSPFGGSSVFGQKPAFGGFGSSPTQSSPFGGASQQSQPAFGSSQFGSSTPFGASSQPSFGANSTPAFGATNTPAFGATSTPAFGSTTSPVFGNTASPVFGSGGAFGASSTPAFGASSTPAFGTSSTPAFGASSTPAFGTFNTPAFGASSSPAFGAPTALAFGSSSSPSFSNGSTSAFGQSTSAFGSNQSGATSPFGAQSSQFGVQGTAPTTGNAGFGPSAFGSQRGGSRVTAYIPTNEVDSTTGAQGAGKLHSISAMPAYTSRSHDELRWEDLQLGDKGGPNPAAQATGGIGFGASNPQSNPFASSATFGQSSSNPFSSSTPSNPFSTSTPSNPFSTQTPSNPFATQTSTFGSSAVAPSSTAAISSSSFGVSSTSSPSLFGSSSPAFGSGSSPSLFGSSVSPAFGSSSSLFGSTAAQGTASSIGSGFGNTQSSSLFQSSAPSLGQTSVFGPTTSSFGQTTAPSFGQSSLFSTLSAGSNMVSSTPSLFSGSSTAAFGQTIPSLSTPLQSSQPTQPPGAFGFGNFGQSQSAGTSIFGGTPSNFGRNTFGQLSTTQSAAIVQTAPVTSPFGTLPAVPQMSIGQTGTSPSIQYGISSMPVVDKSAPVRISPFLTPRHLSQRWIRLPARKYHPKTDGVKVPFFSEDEETPSNPKADALFIPRENPRALVIHPVEQWSLRRHSEKASPSEGTSVPVHENGLLGKISKDVRLNGSTAEYRDMNGFENGQIPERTIPFKPNQKANGLHNGRSCQNGDSHVCVTGHNAGEGAMFYEQRADVEALMPKLCSPGYYTQPRIEELAAKERAEPGFCGHVKDFVIGRHGYGSIKFFGETNVRALDFESLVQFNNREVIVYMDERTKPPVGQGLNKSAEVTLLNIKCFDKKNGHQYTEGPKIGKYIDMLKRKAENQGAEFVSYDPIKGEWKFKVSHFSIYKLGEEDD